MKLCHSFVYKRHFQLTDNNFELLRDIRPYKFEPLAKKVTDSINYEELAAASADVDPEEPPVPPTPGPNPQQELDWCVPF